MSNKPIKIDGSEIRRRLRAAGLPGGVEKECCGGRLTFSKDYETQLKRLGLYGIFDITERGVLMARVAVK